MTTDPAVPGVASRLGIWLALGALVAIGVVRYEGFATAFAFTTFLNVNAMFVLVCIGLALVVVTGRVDLSVGAVAAVTSVVAAHLSGLGLAAAVLGAAAVGLGFGAVNAIAVVAFRLPSVVVTLATMLAGRAAAGVLGRQPAAIDWTTDFTRLGTGRLFDHMPVTILLVGAVALVAWWVLEATPLGRAARWAAVSDKPPPVVVFVFVFSGLCAGLAGAMLASVFAAGRPNGTWGWEVAALAAVLAGGARRTGGGSIPATVGGALVVSLVFALLNFENGRGLDMTVWWQAVVLVLIVLAVFALRAAGRVRAKRPRA